MTVSTACDAMGHDKIRYLVFTYGRWRWCPTAKMRAKGFRLVNFGPVLTADDKARAVRLNDEWDLVRRALVAGVSKFYPIGSIGEGYQRAIKLRAAERKNKGIVWTKEQESRDDWPRAWKWVEPVFGDCNPRTVQPEQLLALRTKVTERVSASEAFRVVKVWRALWKKLATMHYCDRDNDPSLLFANSAPDPRAQVWRQRDVLRMVQRAWREEYFGLASVIATAWDTMLSPIDVRKLTAAQRARDGRGAVFFLDRAKTGRAAAGTLSQWATAILDAYLARLGATLHDDAPIFRNRSGAPYSKDTLGDDFRRVRALVFGPEDDRQLQDMRRSGAVEAIRGNVKPAKLSTKMANTLSQSNRLHRTYVPVDVSTVRDVDDARAGARVAERREQRPKKSLMKPAGKV
jgi:hypothetical protein